METLNPLAEAFGSNVRWVVWKMQNISGRNTKVPYAVNGRKASSTDSHTWSDLETVMRIAGRYSGVGIMFGGSVLGIDIDHVIENGVIVGEKKAEIEKLIETANTYTEISPSGTGLHLLFALSEPLELEANRKAPYECYTEGRFFTVTWNAFGDAKNVRIVSQDEAIELLEIIGYPWATKKEPKKRTVPQKTKANGIAFDTADADVLQQMYASKYGSKLIRLFSGDTSAFEGDESRADLALCSALAYWTSGNPMQMERIWLASPLGSREKTQERADYRERTIQKAIEGYEERKKQKEGFTAIPELEPKPEQFDISKFMELTPEALLDVLNLTIKRDEENKLVTFLCELLVYTDSAQFNISFNAPSSSGKSYIPTETAKLFPSEDVMEVGYCSPTAFFHDRSQYEPRTNTYFVDLSGKILIFMDMPHQDLLVRLRPLLSHDKKIITSKITDKNMRGGNQTKSVQIKGYPSVIFCTAGLDVDEQEATRFLLLSPETSQEKLHDGIAASIRKETDIEGYTKWLESNPQRQLLKERIRAIKAEGIEEINIENSKRIEDLLLAEGRQLKPRNQRDVKRLMSFAKGFALLNVWYRERRGTTLFANDTDVLQAIELWKKLAISQELNLPPYVYDLYYKVILAARADKLEAEPLQNEFGEQRVGLTYQEILHKYHKVEGRPLPMQTLARSILPMLETSGLIAREKSDNDRRVWLVFPLMLGDVLDTLSATDTGNSGGSPGVEATSPEAGDFDADIEEAFS